MRKTAFFFLSCLLLLAGLAISCEEVEEAGQYDNWKERNEAFVDSLNTLVENNYVASVESADGMALGTLFAIQIPNTSTIESPQYVYCKKLVSNKDGVRPMYTGYHSTVKIYYCGTLITGEQFDARFDGYGALDKTIPIPPVKVPSQFDSPMTSSVTGFISGFTWPLQYMRAGERWILYIPWQSGYGSSANTDGTIPGYSTLTFDLILDRVE